MAKGRSDLVYKLTLDTGKAEKDLDKLVSKISRVEKKWQFGSSSAAFGDKFFKRPLGWESSKAFKGPTQRWAQMQYGFGDYWGGKVGMSGMSHLQGTPMIPKAVSAAGTVAGATDEATKRLGLLDKVSDKLSTTFGMTSIKAMTLGGSFNTLVTGLMKLNPLVVGLTLMFGKLMERTFHYGNIIEQSRMVLTSAWSSEKRAVKAIQGMREFSRVTQHSPEEVVGATTMLAKYNIDPFEKGSYGLAGNKNVMNLMSGLAAMPGMGGEPIGLDRAVNAAIAGRDVRPLKALGPEVIAAYDKAREAGMSGTPEYIKVMLEELAKVPKIMELANAQANTMSTMWSTITGYAEEFFMDFSGAGEEAGIVTLWSQLKDILMVIRDEGEKFVIYVGPFLTEFGAALGAGFKFLFDSVRLVWSVIGPVLIPAFKILIQLVRIVFEVFKAVLNTVIQVGKILVTIVKLPFQMLTAILGVEVKIESVLDKLRKVVLGLQMTFMFLRIFMEGVVEEITLAVDYILRKIEEFVNKFKWFFEGIGEGVMSAVGINPAMAQVYKQGFDNMKGGISGFVQDNASNLPTTEKTFQEMNASEISQNLLTNSMGTIISKFLRDSAKEERKYQESKKTTINNTTINNYETQKTDIEQIKNMSGVVDVRNLIPGMRRR